MMTNEEVKSLLAEYGRETTFDAKQVHQDIVAWTRNWFEANGKDSKAVIGISGGKDSTICAAILAEALGKDRVVGVMMPNGEQKDICDSHQVIEMLGIQSWKVNIENAYKGLTEEICASFINNELPKLYTTNTPARLRMAALYGIAAIVDGRVCNTCNASEDFVGYSTKWGDATGDFSLLSNLTVSEVRMLGLELGLPEYLVMKTPSDGMCGSSDEDNLGFSYDFLDAVIRGNVRPGDYILTEYPELYESYGRIMRMHNNPNTKAKLVIGENATFPFQPIA